MGFSFRTPRCCSFNTKNVRRTRRNFSKILCRTRFLYSQAFFGKYPELLEMVKHLTDDDLTKLNRGGHDPNKMYAAYKTAVDNKDTPSVILAHSVKGYGMGETMQGRNVTHQQKKLAIEFVGTTNILLVGMNI